MSAKGNWKFGLGVIAAASSLVSAVGLFSVTGATSKAQPAPALTRRAKGYADSATFATNAAKTGEQTAEIDGLRAFLSDQVSRLSADPGATLVDTLDDVGSAQPPQLNASDVRVLAGRCAPSAPASVLVAIVRTESGFAPLAIRLNGLSPRVYQPRTTNEAVELAQTLLAQHRNIDLGLAQINSRNLSGLGLSVTEAFDPCRNLSSAAVILNRGYERALQIERADRPILQMAYSIYNTGDADHGLFNGYVAKIEAARRRE